MGTTALNTPPPPGVKTASLKMHPHHLHLMAIKNVNSYVCALHINTLNYLLIEYNAVRILTKTATTEWW
jgi:hypothetical protein